MGCCLSSLCNTTTTQQVIQPINPSERISEPSKRISEPPSSQSMPPPSFNNPSTKSFNYETTYSSSYYRDSWKSSSSTQSSNLSSLRLSLSENPHIYSFSEITSATNNFLTKPLHSSSSSTSWKCIIRDKNVVVCQRKFRRRIELSELRDRLLLICKSHHNSLIDLKGASISGNYIYLVYDYVNGANLSNCLRNPRNPNFTVLSSWMSRIQIATDLAHGIDYLHHSTGLEFSFVHNHIKSCSIIVTDEPSLNAKICHFGTSELCGEILRNSESETVKEMKRLDSGGLKFEGTRGYMSPEFQSTGVPTQKSDVFSFGVVILELLSGEEPLKYRLEDNTGRYERISVTDTAREAVEGGGGGVRRWVDKRLKDSFPVEVAEKMVKVGLECVAEDLDKRPDMGWVAGRISKLYLESKTWAEKMKGVPNDFTGNYNSGSVSFAPR